jgi:hypothetical protein
MTRGCTSTSRFDEIRVKLKQRLNGKDSYRMVASEMNMTAGGLWKFINTAYIPKRPQVRRKLLRVVPGKPKKNWHKKYLMLRRWIKRKMENSQVAY